MAVRIRFRKYYECDTEAERNVDWGADSLIYTLDTGKYFKILAGDYVEVPADEVIFASPIPITKVAISGVSDGTRFLRDDGAWAEVPAVTANQQMLIGSFRFDNSTTMADPGTGDLRLNNATFASVTQVAINVISNGGLDLTLLFQAIQSGDPLYIQDKDDSTKAIRLVVSGAPTNNTTWFQFPVTYVSSVGTLFANNALLAVGFNLMGSVPPGYTDEMAQDAIGAMVSSEFTYTDATPLLSINSIAWSKITGAPAFITLTSLSSTATGLTYTNTTGVFSLTGGYVIPTTTEQTNWTTAYTNRITSLTTTGSSGAATLISNALNIPTYTLAGLGGISGSGVSGQVAYWNGTSSITGATTLTYDATNGFSASSVNNHTLTSSTSSTILSLHASGSSTGLIAMLSSSVQRNRLMWSSTNPGWFESGLGFLNIIQPSLVSGWYTPFTVAPGTHTGITTEVKGADFWSGGKSWAFASTVGSEKYFHIGAITATGSAPTVAYSLYVDAPIGATTNWAIGTTGNINMQSTAAKILIGTPSTDNNGITISFAGGASGYSMWGIGSTMVFGNAGIGGTQAFTFSNAIMGFVSASSANFNTGGLNSANSRPAVRFGESQNNLVATMNFFGSSLNTISGGNSVVWFTGNNGTAPTANNADVVALYVLDNAGAGTASLNYRFENGTVHSIGNLVSIGTDTPTSSTRLDVRGLSGGTNIFRLATFANAPVLTVTDTLLTVTAGISANSSTADSYTINGSWTTAANNSVFWNFLGNITARATTFDSLYGVRFGTTMNAGANGQGLYQFLANPNFVLGANTGVDIVGWYYNASISGTENSHRAMLIVNGAVQIGSSAALTIGDVLVDLSSTTKALVITRFAGDVATPVAGMVHYNSTTNKFRFRENTTWVEIGTGSVADGDKGDITVSSSGTVWTIDNTVVTYAKIQNVTTSRFLGRITAGAGVTEELTGTQATSLLDLFSTSATTKGLVPGSNGVGATFFLNANGGWAIPAGGGSGTVTATGGALTANSVILGAGGVDIKVVAGIITDGVSVITLGVNTTTIGKLKMFGNTSGDVTIQPTAVAGTATVQTLPATTGTLVNRVTTGNGVSASNTDGALSFTLGVITPTSVNGLTLTALATGFSIAGGTTSKTLTISNTLTFQGTDSSTLNIGAGGTLGSAAFTNTSAYLSSATNSTQEGYFTGVRLLESAGATFYLRLIAGSDLTANRTLTITTGDVDRTLTLTGNATISGINTGDQTGVALTKTDDTNVTLTLGGSPTTALFTATSLTLGWTGTLADGRIASAANWNTAYTNRITALTTTGSSGAATLISNTLNIPTYTLAGLGGFANPMTTLGDVIYGGASGTATRLAGDVTDVKKFLSATSVAGVAQAPSWVSIAAADIPASALTKTDDTNVTLTLGGTPASSLLAAVSLTLGWTGTLADGRITSAATWNAKIGGSIASNQIAYGSGASTIQGSANFTWDGTNMLLNNSGAATMKFGASTGLSTATPTSINMGGTYADTVVSSKAKWKLYEDGTAINTYGIGITAGQMNFFKLTGGSYKWFFSDVEKLQLTETALIGIATFSLFNSVTTNLSFAGAATTLTMGASTGTVTINNPLLILPTAGSRLGVGTSTPGVINGTDFSANVKFHVSKTASAGSYMAVEGNTGQIGYLLNDTSQVANSRMWFAAYLTGNTWNVGPSTDAGVPTAKISMTSAGVISFSNYSTNGFVKFSGATGTLVVDTNTYLTANQSITLSGDVSGTGTTAITTAIGANKVLYSMIQQASVGYTIMVKATTGAGNYAELALGTDAVWARSGSGNIISLGAANDTVLLKPGAGNLAWSTISTNHIGASQVTYAKIQNVTATARLLGRITAGAGVIEELTGTQATSLLNVFTSGLNGLVPASGGGTTNFLRADGAWASPGGGGMTRSVVSISASGSAGATAQTDYVYFASGTITITLPTAAGNTNRYTIKNVGFGIITINTTSSQTIDDALSATIYTHNNSVDLVSDGSNWKLI
jgi:hypothetical protein